MSELEARCKLWIARDDDSGVFGAGKMRLLQAIQCTGSLRQAAASLHMSYRKAWGDLKKAEACMQMTLLEKTRGGRDGGHSVLTESGQRLVAAYQRYTDQVQDHMEQAFATLMETMESNGPQT